MEKSFLAIDDSLSKASEFIEIELKSVNCDSKSLNQILVAFEEVFVNIGHYAYPNGEGNIDIKITVDDNLVTIVFKDSGMYFNPLEKEDPDISLSIEDRRIGGLRNLYCKKNDG